MAAPLSWHAEDMKISQSEAERSSESKGSDDGAAQTTAATHGALPQLAGFDLWQLGRV
jgi:hypothetical protein